MPVALSGPDSPVSLKDQDDLERWWFAREAFDLASTAPEEWSIRVGIYGAWGTGKTSILGFVKTLCAEAGHVPVEFNPWGCRTPDEMWRAFAVSVHTAFEQAGVEIPQASSTRLRAWLAERSTDALKITEGHEVAGTVAKLLSALSSPALTFGIEDLIKLQELVRPRRVLVLIDDVDRVDPGLLPGLLYSLKELLGAPGFSFILALDPDVVAPALAAHHPGWGDGYRFLEKIIDFPMNLPAPSRDALWALARRDLDAYCSFIDKEAARRTFDLFPTNPRALRQYIRHLWSLKREVERHNPEEIDWTVLLLVQLMKFRWPEAARLLFGDEELIKQITIMRFFTTRRTDPSQDVGSLVRQALERAGVPASEAAHAERVALALGDRAGLTTGDKIAYHARITERPDAVTWKEFDDFLATADPDVPATLQGWMEEHADAREITQAAVAKELFGAARLRWHHSLEQAADCKTDDELAQHVDDAAQCLRLLTVMALELKWLGAPPAFLGAEAFQQALGTALGWVHFTNHESYASLRSAERDLVIRMAQDSGIPAVDVFDAVEPKIKFPGSLSTERPEAKAILQELRSISEPGVCEFIVDQLHAPSGTRYLFQKDRYLLKNLLLDPGSTIYSSDELRARMTSLASDAATMPEVQKNCIDLVFQLAALLKDPAPTEEYKLARSTVIERHLGSIAWMGATASRLQPRIQGSLVEARKVLEGVIEEELPQPSWWALDDESASDGAASDGEESEGE